MFELEEGENPGTGSVGAKGGLTKPPGGGNGGNPAGDPFGLVGGNGGNEEPFGGEGWEP